MILLFNACITPSSSSCSINYDRGILPNFDKIDIIHQFCITNNIIYSELMKLIEIRDEIIKDLTFNMNLNPMTNNHKNLSALLNSSNTFNEAIEMIQLT